MPKKKEPVTAFGARLVELRKAKGLTQAQLGEAAGSSQRMISLYESTSGHPTAPVIAELAKALGVTTDALLGLEKPKQRSTVADSPETRRLWKQFQRLIALPEKDRRAVIRLLNSLTRSP